MKRYLWLFLSLMVFQITACKEEQGNVTSEESMQDFSSCTSADVNEDEANDICVSNTLPPPDIVGIGEAPLVLTRTPRIAWTISVARYLGYSHILQVQILNALDKSVVYPWSELSGEYVEGLNLVEGQEYFLKLRIKVPGGKKTKAVKSEKWKARVGVGAWDVLSSVNAPAAPGNSSIVWTGSKLIVWGGVKSGVSNPGAIYDPSTDSWQKMSTVNAPVSRGGSTAVWTGSEMIVWGGSWLRTGARYNLATDTWSPISSNGAPTGCVFQTAVWTGSKMIVWGGEMAYGNGRRSSNQGAAYDPTTNTWSAISDINAPSGRNQHVAVWTGSEMLVWGGSTWDGLSSYNANPSGGLYDPSTDSWRSIASSAIESSANYREGYGYHWTGTRLITLDRIYDLRTNTWSEILPASKPWDRSESAYLPNSDWGGASTWTGSQFFIWGGTSWWGNKKNGGMYDPAKGSWVGTTLDSAPASDGFGSAIWTGSKVLIWTGSQIVTFTP